MLTDFIKTQYFHGFTFLMFFSILMKFTLVLVGTLKVDPCVLNEVGNPKVSSKGAYLVVQSLRKQSMCSYHGHNGDMLKIFTLQPREGWPE